MPTNKKKRKKELRQTFVDAGLVETPKGPLDPEVNQEFEEAQRQSGSGSRQLAQKLSEHHSQSPELTAGDIDAAWDRSDVGEESPGGSVSTPDQDIVDEIGKAVGLTFEDNEPVDAPSKLERRDSRRWELDPASAEDHAKRRQEQGAIPKSSDRK